MNGNQHPLALGKPPGDQSASEISRAHECRYPGCSTITLDRYCTKHRNLGRAQPALEELRPC